MAQATSSSSAAPEPAQAAASHTTHHEEAHKTGSSLRPGAAVFAPAGPAITAQQHSGAAAAFLGPFVVGRLSLWLQPPASSERHRVRIQNLLAALLHGPEHYGVALNDEAKLACLARLTADSLNSILAEPNPDYLLDALWVMYQQHIQHHEAPLHQCEPHNEEQQHCESCATQQPQVQQDVFCPMIAGQHPHSLQRQEQGGGEHQQLYVYQQLQQQSAPINFQQQVPPSAYKVLGPKELDPTAAVAFEAALPAGLLPEGWRDLLRWGHLEMHCKFTVCGTDQQSVQDIRNKFTHAKEQAVAATQAARQQSSASIRSTQVSIPSSNELTTGASTTSATAEQVTADNAHFGKRRSFQQQPSSGVVVSVTNNLQRSSSIDSSSRSHGQTHHSIQQSELYVGHEDGHILPFHVPESLRGQFVGSLPQGALPECWHTFNSWKSLEASVNLDAFSAPYPSRLQDVHMAFSNAVFAIIQACQSVDEWQGHWDEQQQSWQGSSKALPPLQQQQQCIRPCDLPAAVVNCFAASLPRDMLPYDWQSYEDWKQLESDLYLRSARGRQMFRRAKSAILKDVAGLQAQLNGQQEEHQVLHPSQWHYHQQVYFTQQQGFPAPQTIIEMHQDQYHAAQSQQGGQGYSQGTRLPDQPGASNFNKPQRQHGCRNTVAPCDLPAAVARLLESMIPEGMLPADWQQYESWSDLDVNVSFTAGSAHPDAIQENNKLYKEAKQAALAAAKATAADGDMQPPCLQLGASAAASRSPVRLDGQHQGTRQLLERQQQGARQGNPSSNGSSSTNGNTSSATPAAPVQQAAASSNCAAPAVPAAEPSTALKRAAMAGKSPPSVSWVEAAAVTANTIGTHTTSAAAATTAAPASTAPVSLTRAASSDGFEYLSCRSRSDDSTASSHPIRRSTVSNSSGFQSSGDGSTSTKSSNSVSATAACTAYPILVKPRNKYIPADQSVCYRCGFCGHLGEQCTTPYCGSCDQWGHVDGVDCLSACYWCGRLHKNSGPRCDQPECRGCKLTGHKTWECPLTVCKFCKCNGHTDRQCRACGECKQWGHTIDKCSGYCKKCNVAGHRTAECKVKHCPQCGQAGCVVGMCNAATDNSNGSRQGSSRESGGIATAAAPVKFNVRTVSFDIAVDEQQEEEHRQRLMDRLMNHPKLEQYAYGLLMDTEKLAVLAGVAAADLSLILQQEDPVGLLEELYAMQALDDRSSKCVPATAATVTATTSSRVAVTDDAEVQPQQQQQQQHQQQHKVILPCDLWPRHRHMFEGRLPCDSLPDNWWEYTSWRELEKVYIVSFRDSGARISEQRIMFRRERQRVQAAAVADMALESCASQVQNLQQQAPPSSHSQVLGSQQQRCEEWSGHHDTQQQGNEGWEKPSLQQQQQQPQQLVSDDGWPDLHEDDQGEWSVENPDSWAAVTGEGSTAAAQTQAVTENAWARGLPHVQQKEADQQQAPARQPPLQQPGVQPTHKQGHVESERADVALGQHSQQHGQHATQLNYIQPQVYNPAAAAAVSVPGMPIPMQQASFQLGQCSPPSLQPQQQQAPSSAYKVLGPKELDPTAAVAFEAALPAGLLPEGWRDLLRWGHLEMHCKFTVCGTDQQSVQDARNKFTHAKEQAVAATQAVFAAQQEHQQFMLMQQQYMVAGGIQQPVRMPAAAVHAPVTGVVPPSMIYVVGPDALQQQGIIPGHCNMPVSGVPMLSHQAGGVPHPVVLQHHGQGHAVMAGPGSNAMVASTADESDAEEISSMMDMLVAE